MTHSAHHENKAAALAALFFFEANPDQPVVHVFAGRRVRYPKRDASGLAIDFFYRTCQIQRVRDNNML